MMKIVISAMAVFLVIAFSACGVTAHDMKPPALLRRTRVSSSPSTCADNITAAMHDLISAGESVVHAAFDCPNKNKTASCISDIADVSKNLIAAGKRIDEAVTACGGHGSACVQDLLSAGQAVTGAAEEIAQAIAQCSQKEILRCVEDVTNTALDIEDLVGAIRKAAMQCGKTLKD